MRVSAFATAGSNERVLEALALAGRGWTRVGAWTSGDLARVPPFEAIELSVRRECIVRGTRQHRARLGG
jgi:hypothetical protein